jgi:hypothetical protein
MVLNIVSDLQSDFGGVLDIIEVIIKLICVVVPIILVVICSIDFAKAVISHDDDALKKALTASFKRLIAGVIIFMLPYIVSFVMGIVGGSDYEDAKIEGTYEEVKEKEEDS